MKKILFTVVLAASFLGYTQNQIGHRTVTYADATRMDGFGSGGGPGRQIQCEIYYPAATSGDNVPMASGAFPVITFGHGFVMAWDAYTNIWEHYVPLGYVMIFPRTEGGFSPVHSEFGKDLVYAANQYILSTSVSTSPFFAHYNGRNAVMGHSMGGGSSVLAASEINAPFDVLIGLAPAETNPEASLAAINVDLPTVIFSGSGDAVTPEADHHLPIFNGLASACKQYISINGGAHCYFANTNTNCDLGEIVSGGSITIDRAEQHDILFDLMDSYLDFHLKTTTSSWAQFLTAIQDSRVVETNTCTINPLSVNELDLMFEISPNPSDGMFVLNFRNEEEHIVELFNSLGERILVFTAKDKVSVNIDEQKAGVYFVKAGSEIQRIVKL